MECKTFEIRDDGTFCAVICIRPVPTNERQRWLLRRDGYSGDVDERCVILITPQCERVNYDPYQWRDRTYKVAHNYIAEHWHDLRDGDVVDVEFILGETAEQKISERAFPLF